MNRKGSALGSQTDGERLRTMNDEEIDLSEAPELGDAFFAKARLRQPRPKRAISIRLDPDILAYFKSFGPHYQTKINAVLRKFMEDHQAA